MIDYINSTPRLNSDPTSIMYSLLSFLKPGSLVLDGMGNDVYIGHMPSLKHIIRFKAAQYGRLFLGNNFFNRSNLSPWASVGLRGEGWYSQSVRNKYAFLEKGDENYEEYRSRVRGGILDPEVFMWKSINYGYQSQTEIYFPWSSSKIAELVISLGRDHFFKVGLNKFPIREYLERKYEIDFSKIGKRGFSTTTEQMSLIHPSGYGELHPKVKPFVSKDTYRSLENSMSFPYRNHALTRIGLLNAWIL